MKSKPGEKSDDGGIVFRFEFINWTAARGPARQISLSFSRQLGLSTV
jgi:hypothetical protein